MPLADAAALQTLPQLTSIDDRSTAIDAMPLRDAGH